MTEPIYEYVRGTGWVIETPEILTLRCGTKVRLEVRTPREGERFSQISINGEWFADGRPTKRWKDCISDYNFEGLNLYPRLYIEDYIQCVAVPV